MKKLTCLLILLICIPVISVSAQKRAFTIADLYKIKGVESPVISTDGKRIAFVERNYDLPKGKTFTNVYVMNTDGADKVAITTSGKGNEPFWSSDNKNLYYVSSESGAPQVYRYSFTDSKTEKLTDFSMGIGGPVLSPDNQLIAFATDVYPECGADSRANAIADSLATNGPTQAYLADHLLFRHWTSYSEGKCSHIIIYNIAKQTYTDLTPGNFVSPIFMLGGGIGFNFSPDSKELCFVSNHTDHPEANTNADMFLIPVTGGQSGEHHEKTTLHGTVLLSIHPTANTIAYRKQMVPGHESDRFRMALYNRQTGTSEIITDTFDNWVNDFKWNADSKSIYFSGDVTGNQPIYKIDIASKKITPVSGDKATFAFDLDNKGNIYYTASSTGKPVALYRQNLAKGKTTQITFLNEELGKTQ